MNTKIFVTTVLITAVLIHGKVFAQDYFYSQQITKEKYQEELAKIQTQKQKSELRIAQLENEITRLHEDISELNKNIAKVRRETLQILNAVADNSFQISRGQSLESGVSSSKSKMD